MYADACTTYIPVTQNYDPVLDKAAELCIVRSFVRSVNPARPSPKRLHNTLSAYGIFSPHTARTGQSLRAFFIFSPKRSHL